MNRPHILFVYAPGAAAPAEGVRCRFWMCMGGGYITAYLNQQGLYARHFLSRDPITINECAARILAMNPHTVGFTVDDTNYFICQLMAQKLKTVAPHIPVIFGGLFATLHARTILEKNPAVDICARKESEETCLELLTLLDNSRFDLSRTPLDKIDGITYRAGNRIYENPDRRIFDQNRDVKDFLDKYPSPYLSGIVDSHKLGIITARGCNQNCSFCVCTLMAERAILTHSVDRVVEELDYISRFLNPGENGVLDIFDDTFTLLPERAKAICRKIIENKIKLSLTCLTRCDKIDEELLHLMREAGMVAIEFSLESAVPRVLRKMGKVQPFDTTDDPTFEKEKEFIRKLEKYVKMAKEIGFKNVFTSIIIGMPTETPEEGRQTIEFVNNLAPYIDLYGHNTFQARPGTRAFRFAPDHGVTVKQCENGVHYETFHSYEVDDVLPAAKSSVDFLGFARDRGNLTALSFSDGRENPPLRWGEGFKTVILLGETVSEELVMWLREYLVINGVFLQLYPSMESIRSHYPLNQEVMTRFLSPTLYYHGYYRASTDDGINTFLHYRTLKYGPEHSIPLFRVKTRAVMSPTPLDYSPLSAFTVDVENVDTQSLYGLLSQLGESRNDGREIEDIPIYPYLTGLCRWEKGVPNCRRLDTLIVDEVGNIKTCWNGSPVGTVGTPLPEIARTIDALYSEITVSRDCGNCSRMDNCPGCIFPHPLTESEYCRFMRVVDIAAPAELLRAVDIYKSLGKEGEAVYHGTS